MIDEIARLEKDRELRQLLGHYVNAGAADREMWLDRRMELAGADAKELARLHGDLLAFGWVEQNTGAVAAGSLPGRCPQSYRTTTAGRRALQRVLAGQEDDLENAA
jgi:hypothetical protein